MSDKKQSSIDWLLSQFEEHGYDGIVLENVVEQAKAMHKEEVIDAWCDGFDEDNRATSNPYMYYTETFGGNNE